MKEREKFSSRLGFILISAGCAIGLGNVWRFPYITGQYGGAAFVFIYLLFLLILGLPIMVMEFSVGRASQLSAARSFHKLEPKGSKWHLYSYGAMLGNYLLMAFYTTVGGWLIAYVYKMAKGEFVNVDPDYITGSFSTMLQSPGYMTICMAVVVLACFAVCSFGLRGGVEKINKILMLGLLAIIVVLVFRSVTLDGAAAGLEFYLKPDFSKLYEAKGGRRSNLHHHSGYLCRIDGGYDHLPGLLGIRYSGRLRPEPAVHHPAEHLQSDGRRTHLGHAVLHVHGSGCLHDHHRGIREHHLVCD